MFTGLKIIGSNLSNLISKILNTYYIYITNALLYTESLSKQQEKLWFFTNIQQQNEFEMKGGIFRMKNYGTGFY